MPDQMTLEQFGAKIKAKYPEYASLPDVDIANKVIAKYPQYKTSIKDDTLSEAGTAKAPDWRDKYTTFTHQSDTPVHAVEDVFGNIGAAALNTVLRPGDTAKGVFRMSGPGVIEDLVLGRKIAPLELGESIIKHPVDTAESMIGSAAVFGAGEEVVGPVARGLRDTAAKARDSVTSAPRTVRELVKGAQKENSEVIAPKNAKIAKENADDLKAHQDAVKKVQAGNIKTLQEHLAEVDEVAKERQAAGGIVDAREGLENLAKEKTAEADVRTEKARHDALEEGNDKYNGVNGKLDPIEADPIAVRNMTVDARSIISDQRGKLPSLLKDFDDRVNGTSVTGSPNGPLNYDELQKWYSKFGNEISKGNIPGEEFHAYDKLHEAIGKEMQRIADSQGQGEALKVAREYWRRMKQTFGKSSDTINNRAGKAVKEAGPSYIDQQEEEYRNRLLASFDPEIPKLLEAAKSARDKAGELPSDSAARGFVKPYPEPPTPEPLPNNPDLKAEVPKATITREDIEAAKRGKLQKDADIVRSKGAFGATVLSLYALRSIIHGEFSPILSVPGDVGAALLVTHGIAKFMERPSVVKFFSRATPKDIAQIPPDLYSDLKPLVQAAQKQGIKVSPALAALVGAAAARGPKSQKIQQTRDDWYRTHPR